LYRNKARNFGCPSRWKVIAKVRDITVSCINVLVALTSFVVVGSAETRASATGGEPLNHVSDDSCKENGEKEYEEEEEEDLASFEEEEDEATMPPKSPAKKKVLTILKT
jgi:hypothetical protein